MTRYVVRTMCALFISGFIGVPTASAQDSALRTYNANPLIISGQIRLALQREQQAQAILATGSLTTESVPSVRAIVHDGYAMVRFAVGGVRTALGKSRFPDPTLQIQNDLMERARADLRRCMTELDRMAVGQANRFDAANESLRSAIETLLTVQALLP